MTDKNILIEEELHKKVKIIASEKGISIKKYIKSLIKEDLKENE
jgi:predicted DNA binding CopG/RHH family protein